MTEVSNPNSRFSIPRAGGHRYEAEVPGFSNDLQRSLGDDKNKAVGDARTEVDRAFGVPLYEDSATPENLHPASEIQIIGESIASARQAALDSDILAA